jgi:tol-pal system protein YbgF
MAELRSELAAIRKSQSVLEERLFALENERAIRRQKAPPPEVTAEAAPPAPTPTLEVPSLHVVKLKPKSIPAPPLETAIPVVEPSPTTLSAIAEDNAVEEKDLSLLEADFQKALSALRTGSVEGGAKTLLEFAHENPKNPRADDALYFSAYGQMGLGKYAEAASLLEELLHKYPAGDVVADALLKLAECQLKLQKPLQARALLSQVLSQYPGTAAAGQAEHRLAALTKKP